MIPLKYIKTPPTTYLIKFVSGKRQRAGRGLSFWYLAPTTTLVAVPVGTTDQGFIFEEISADFQQVSIQGQVTYLIDDPEKIAAILDFSLAARGGYASDDPEKLAQRVVNIIKVLTRKALKALRLEEAVCASETIAAQVSGALGDDAELAALGVSVVGFSILAIRPTPEALKALEAETREGLLKQADEAIFERRNAAIEHERAIKENELNTEIAVEEKRRQIRETQMDAEQAVQRKAHELEQEAMVAKIALEAENKNLVALTAENTRTRADADAYSVGELMKAVASVDPKVLQAITISGMSPQQLISQAFQGLAEGAGRIGELNISPELLGALIKKTDADGPA